jgi:hypothetical protein
MDDPYNLLWLIYKYSEQRLVTTTCAKAFFLTLEYITRYFVHKSSRTQGLLEGTSGKSSSSVQQ